MQGIVNYGGILFLKFILHMTLKLYTKLYTKVPSIRLKKKKNSFVLSGSN